MIVDNPSSHKLGTRCNLSRSKHEGPTGLAEGIGHRLAGCGSLGLGEDGEIILTPSETGMGIESCEIGCEHRSRDLSTVGTVAYEGVGEAWLLQRLHSELCPSLKMVVVE